MLLATKFLFNLEYFSLASVWLKEGFLPYTIYETDFNNYNIHLIAIWSPKLCNKFRFVLNKYFRRQLDSKKHI